MSSQMGADDYPSNPFKNEPWSTSYGAAATAKTCVHSATNTELGGEWWAVGLDGGAVEVHSVAILNSPGASSAWLEGLEVRVGGSLCHTITGTPLVGAWMGFSCSATGATLELRAAAGKYLFFCGIRVWKAVADVPTGYRASELAYRAAAPDLPLAYPGLGYEDVLEIQQIDPEGDALDLTLKVRPWSAALTTSPLSLALEDLLMCTTCWPHCAAMTIKHCNDVLCGSLVAGGEVTLSSPATTHPVYAQDSYTLRIERDFSTLPYAIITYIEWTGSAGCAATDRKVTAALKVVLCG